MNNIDIDIEVAECRLGTAQCHACGARIDDNETPVIDFDDDGEPVSVVHATCS